MGQFYSLITHLSGSVLHADSQTKYEEARQRQEEKAFGLGEIIGASPELLENLASRLFESDHAPYRTAFGRGLVSAAAQPRDVWQVLLEKLRDLETQSFDFCVLSGAFEELSKSDPKLTAEFLDAAADDELLKPNIVGLHPYARFSNDDFDRCLKVFEEFENSPHGFEVLFWGDRFQEIEYGKLVRLAKLMLQKNNGEFAFLEAMTMRLHDKQEGEDALGEELRRLAIRAAANHFLKDDPHPGGSGDYRLTEVVLAFRPVYSQFKMDHGFILGC